MVSGNAAACVSDSILKQQEAALSTDMMVSGNAAARVSDSILKQQEAALSTDMMVCGCIPTNTAKSSNHMERLLAQTSSK